MKMQNILELISVSGFSAWRIMMENYNGILPDILPPMLKHRQNNLDSGTYSINFVTSYSPKTKIVSFEFIDASMTKYQIDGKDCTLHGKFLVSPDGKEKFDVSNVVIIPKYKEDIIDMYKELYKKILDFENNAAFPYSILPEKPRYKIIFQNDVYIEAPYETAIVYTPRWLQELTRALQYKCISCMNGIWRNITADWKTYLNIHVKMFVNNGSNEVLSQKMKEKDDEITQLKLHIEEMQSKYDAIKKLL